MVQGNPFFWWKTARMMQKPPVEVDDLPEPMLKFKNYWLE